MKLKKTHPTIVTWTGLSCDMIDMNSKKNSMRINELKEEIIDEQRHLSSKLKILRKDRLKSPIKGNHRMNSIEYYEKGNVQISNDRKTVDSPSLMSAKNKIGGFVRKSKRLRRKLYRDQKSKLVLIKFGENIRQISHIGI